MLVKKIWPVKLFCVVVKSLFCWLVKNFLTILKFCLIIALKSLIKGKGKGKVMKKYQLFCTILGALVGANAWAVDTIKAEDEYLVRDIVKVNGDQYIVETKKNIENVPVENLKYDETLVLDDVVIGESVRPEVKEVEANVSHPRERYLSGESATQSLAETRGKKVEIVTDDGQVFIADGEVAQGLESKEDYIDAIAECYDDRSEDLSDAITLYDTGFRSALGNVSQVMTEINHCYEQIGYALIADYYEGSSYMMKKFDEESKKFYVSGSDVNFDPKFCDEVCSVRAIVDAQIAKFADFRIYLTKLLENK